jgi:protein phosphatase
MGVIPSPDTSETIATSAVLVRVYARTDVGRTREHNEDSFLVADLRAEEPLRFDDTAGTTEVRAGALGMLFMVADGLGGAAAGEIASHMAVHTVFGALRQSLPAAAEEPGSFAAALRDAALVANDAIHEHAKRHRELHGMGTTITAAALLGDTLYVAQVGDSRAYLLRDGEARQITKDQSLMQKLLEAGEITPEQAELSARRNIILQALGPETTVKVDLTHQPLRRGDLLLLCSDGLSGQVRSDEIARLAATAADLDALCGTLVQLANDRGGPDNITVVAARFDGEALAPPSHGDAVGHRTYPLAGSATDDQITLQRIPIALIPEPEPPSPGSTTFTTPSLPNAAPGGPPGAPPHVPLDERRERARLYFVLLGAAAVLLALAMLWRFLAR